MKKFFSKMFPVKRQEQLVGFLAASGNLLFWVVPIIVDLYDNIPRKTKMKQNVILFFGFFSLLLAVIVSSCFQLSWGQIFVGFVIYLLAGLLEKFVMSVLL